MPEVSISARPIYLDNAATTPVDPRVVQAMLPWLTHDFGNPASNSHAYGWDAHEAVEGARAHVAALLNTEARHLVWTSGATEAINLALKGAATSLASRGRHVVTVCTEHKAVLDTCRELERCGFEVTYLPVDADGLLDPDVFRNALREDTILASVMWVNNEIGVIQDIPALAAHCAQRGVIFHVDAAQASGKVHIDLQAHAIDLMSLCAHKTYGPKGVGALYVRRRPGLRLHAQIHGGGHERGLRSGTLPTHQIVGMGEAFRLARLEMDTEIPRLRALRDRLWEGLQRLPAVILNGHPVQRVATSLNVSVEGVEGEALLMDLRGLAVSSGSACTSASLEPSYVLRAIGRSMPLAHASLRLSLGRFTTPADVDAAVEQIGTSVARLRDLSVVWEDRQEWAHAVQSSL